jgi:hypothetical protein
MMKTYTVKPVLQMLVYEFMPNGNLRDHLSGENLFSMTNIMNFKVHCSN